MRTSDTIDSSVDRRPLTIRRSSMSRAASCFGGFGESSSNICANVTPPTPSVKEWWTFWMNAARPPSTPSTTVNSQSGRSLSNAAIAIGAAISSTARKSDGDGTTTRRR